MPKNNVSDPITDQEIAFARLILSGTMTDRCAAEAVGLHPNSAAYTKSRPRVRAYLLEHRAAVQQQLVEQDTGGPRRPNPGRDQILARLWEIANLDPERTRGSVSAQVKALSMIVAIEGLIPDRRAVPAQNQSAPPPVNAQIYTAAWLRTRQNGESVNPQPPRAQQEAAPPPVSGPNPDPTPSLSESQTNASPYSHGSTWVPDTRAPFSISKNRFGRRR
jgi:hypothetical protein